MRYIATTFLLSILPIFSIQAQSTSSKEIDTEKYTPCSFDTSQLCTKGVKIDYPETTKEKIIITREEIQQSTNIDLAQLLNSQNGITVINANGNPSSEKQIFMQGARDRHVLILLDGSPVFNATNRTNFSPSEAFDILSIPLNTIEKIEIVKGGQSILYGSYGVAGVISITTRQISDKAIHTSVTRSLGVFDSQSTNIHFSTSDGSTAGFLVDYSNERSDGIDESSTVPFPNFIPDDLDGFVRNGLISRLYISPIKQLRVSSFFYHSNIDRDIDNGSFGFLTQKNTLSNSGTRIQFRSKKLILNANYTYSKSNRKRSDRSSSSFDVSKSKNLDVNGAYPFFDLLSVTTGVARQTIIRPELTNGFEGRSRSAWIPYGLFKFTGLKNLSVDFGSRFIYLSTDTDDENYLAHQVAASYTFLKHFIFSSSYSKQLYGNDNIDDTYFFDAGLQISVLRDKSTLSIRYFNHETNINQDFGSIFQGFRGFLNRQHTSGWEFSLAWDINKYLSFKSYYNYLDGSLDGFFDNDPMNANSTSVPGTIATSFQTPDHQLSVVTSLKPFPEWIINIEGLYTDKREDFSFDTNLTDPNTYITLNAYTLINLYTEYAHNETGLTVFMQFRNILDENFIERTNFNTVGLSATAGFRYTFNKR